MNATYIRSAKVLGDCLVSLPPAQAELLKTEAEAAGLKVRIVALGDARITLELLA